MRLGKKTLQERITEHHKDNPYSVNRVQLDELLQDSITEEVIFHGKELVISFRLPCGFTVAGRSAVVNAERFDLNIGRLLCYEDAIRQLWLLEGYRVQWKMYLDQLKKSK
jgi:hypothetical protein